MREISGLVERELTSVHRATTDALTDLSNRRGFDPLGRYTLELCRRLNAPASLLFFDLDRFRSINDPFGHAEGDRALALFSKLRLEVFRAADAIARIGGDEFCALLTNAAGRQVDLPLGRLDAALEAEHQGGESPWHLGCSVGVTAFDPDRHATLLELAEDADQRMYLRKRDRTAAR